MEVEVKKAVTEVVEPVAKEVKEAKASAEKATTEAGEAKSKVAELETEVKNLREAAVKRDEADKKNQEALDKLVIASQKTAINTEKPKTFNDQIKDAVEANWDSIEKFRRKEVKDVRIELKAVGNMTTANVTGDGVWGAIQRPGIIMNPNRKVHMRQLIGVTTAGPGTDYYFMRENGVGEGEIAPVAEGSTKPQFDLDLVEASVKFETIAGWLRISNKALNNVPGMVSFLQRRLPEKLLNVEDQQILYGTGVSPQIKGILTAGNYQASTSASTIFVEQILDDLARLEDTFEREANGIAMRPAYYYDFFKNKATGSGEYDLPRNVTWINGQLYISGVPVVPTTALIDDDYIVGDFANGAELIVQEGMTLRFFEQDGTNVRENMQTVRIEETVALPVYGDNYFIKGDANATT